MIALGVTFLVAIVLLGLYGLRVRAARFKQAEHGIARLEDALRETDAAIGRVESEIATVTDAVKASLTPRQPAKPGPKAAPSITLRDALLEWYHEEWKPGSKLVPPSRLSAKTAKGRKHSMVHAGQAPYHDAEWSASTRPAPSW